MVAADIPWVCRCSAVQCSAAQCLRAASPKQSSADMATHCASLGAGAACLVRRCSGRSRRTMRRSRRSRSLRRPCGAPRTASVGCAKSAAHTHTHTHAHTHGRNAVAAGLARLIDRSIGCGALSVCVLRRRAGQSPQVCRRIVRSRRAILGSTSRSPKAALRRSHAASHHRLAHEGTYGLACERRCCAE